MGVHTPGMQSACSRHARIHGTRHPRLAARPRRLHFVKPRRKALSSKRVPLPLFSSPDSSLKLTAIGVSSTRPHLHGPFPSCICSLYSLVTSPVAPRITSNPLELASTPPRRG